MAKETVDKMKSDAEMQNEMDALQACIAALEEVDDEAKIRLSD